MQTTSALYNQILADPNHRFEVKLNIGGVDYGTDAIFSAKTDSRLFDSKPTIGGCYAATLDFTILSDGASIPRMASVKPYFRAVTDTQQSEWLQQGLFFIDQRKVTNNGDGLSVFTAECFDAMLKANADYATSSLTWPAVDALVVAEIATAIGVTVDSRTTALLTKGFTIPSVPVGYTYRDILSYIGVVYAGNWIISDEGELRLVPIAGNADTLVIDKELMSMNVSPKRSGYTKVVIGTSESEGVESGSSDDMVMEAYCPYATQAIAGDVLTALSTYQYEPFDASGVWGDPAVEIGDKLTALSKTVTIYARTVNFGPGMVMNLSAPDDGYIDHEYTYESPTERRYTRTIGGLKSELTLAENKIALVVSESGGNIEVNSASIVAAINDSGSSIIINADKIDLEGYVTFSNLKTGGRNAFKGTQLMNGTSSASTGTWAASKFFKSGTGSVSWNQTLSDSPVPDCGYGVTLTASSANTRIGFGQAAYPSLQEGPYTISFWAKGTAGDKVYTFPYYASASDKGSYSTPQTIAATGVWQRFAFTHTADTPNNIGGAYLIGYILFESATAGRSVSICAPKFEYGNVATSWSPAPEDSPTFDDLATAGQTVIDGGNITTNTITADKINLTDLFSQNITATNFNITGGSINITTSGLSNDAIELKYLLQKLKISPSGIVSSGADNEIRANASGVYHVDATNDAFFDIQNEGFFMGTARGSFPAFILTPSLTIVPSLQQLDLDFMRSGASASSFVKALSYGTFGYVIADITIEDLTLIAVAPAARKQTYNFLPMETVKTVAKSYTSDGTCIVTVYNNNDIEICLSIEDGYGPVRLSVGDRIIICIPVLFKAYLP